MEGVCEETRKRVQVTLWAYAYEIQNNSLVSDEKFDETCRQIDLDAVTYRPDLDEWFKKNFVPDTGMWIYDHPELDKAKDLYTRTKIYELVKQIEGNHTKCL